MNTEPEPDATEEDEDECAVDHSWEYLYSVYKCVRCDTVSEDD
jgi:hypothetical protein